jgi:hypothetical protein
MCSLPGAHCRDLLSRVAALSVRRVQSIRQGQQQPPAYSFPRALLFGRVRRWRAARFTPLSPSPHMEIGLIAILAGVMAGKAIRRASGGYGGR